MTVRAAVVGCGDWGRNHAAVLARFGVLAAVADADGDRAQALADRLGCAAMDLPALLADGNIDAVVVALPPTHHAGMAQRVLAAGKHLLVEKPMALTLADARAIRDLAAARGRVAMTGHILRFHPAFVALLGLVQSGRLGRLQRAEARRKGFGKFFPDTDVLWDLAPHDLALLLALTGRAPQTAHGRVARVLSPLADEAELSLDFGAGFRASISLSRVFAGKERQLRVQGARGTAVFDDLAPWPEKLTFAPVGGVPAPVPVLETAPLDAQTRHFLDCIASGTEPHASARHGVEVLELLAGIEIDDIGPAALAAGWAGDGAALRRGGAA